MSLGPLLKKLELKIQSELRSVDRDGLNHLQNFLYFFADPLFSYADSVLILVRGNHYNAAQIILRTMIECHININFHIASDSERRLATTTRELFDERLKGLNGLKQLLIQYPNLQSKNESSILSLKGIDVAIDHQLENRAAVLRANDIEDTKNIIKLRQKAHVIDSETEKKGIFGRLYEIEYRLFSQPAHMNISGLQAFVPTNEIAAMPSKDLDNLVYVGTALDVCLAYAKDLYDHGVIQKDRAAEIGEIEAELITKAGTTRN